MHSTTQSHVPRSTPDVHVAPSRSMFDVFSVVDESTEKINVGELVTYLNDAVMFAPSMLLGPETTWLEVDDRSFDVELSDHRRTVTARVFLDERGALTDFSTTDRFGEDPASPGTLVRTRWTTPVRGWRTVDGRRVASGGKAIWHFPSGDLEYADFAFVDGGLEYDVQP